MLAAPAAAAQWTQNYVSDGGAGNDFYGQSVSGIGDLNGDGCNDILVGVYGADWNGHDSGGVQALSGKDGSVLYEMAGEKPGALLGFALAPLSDYDKDGVKDYAATSPYFSTGRGGFFSGKLYVLSGVDGAVLDTVQGRGAGELLGSSVTGVDLDGDGVLEILIGCIGTNGQRGSVRRYRWSGAGLVAAGAPFHGRASGEMYGFSITTMGDLNMANGDEFAVGAPFADDGGVESGAVEVRGRNSPQIFADFLYPVPGAHLGLSLAGGVDVNGDQHNELAAGAPDDGPGKVVLWSFGSGRPQLRTLEGEVDGDRFGESVAWTGDADFDGRPDLLVGAPDAGGTGAIAVFNVARHVKPLELLHLFGTSNSRLGWSVASVGDITGTGFYSIAVGAPYANCAGSRSGHMEAWTPPTIRP